ncbi:DUF4401 domain-containing protein [Myxococcus stipitatus]|uniref:DUF4401 domain-containing protein n=1 Tax=Myxococcus stipitatus TaxID=83455 RepID=UPI001F3A0783|nr:DUF4401 domain-containing protein [Myxococcus stipitatus]MCE9667495.1 DUF4401 domain-containing protein [Myxococcus stipitatus]
MRPSLQEVLQGLEAEGLLASEAMPRARAVMEVHQRNSTATPWFVKALAGLGAWVAALFLVGLFTCIGIVDNEGAMMGIGLVFCIGATALRAFTSGVFLEQLTMAVCLAGVVMLIGGIAAAGPRELEVAAGSAVVVGTVLLVLFPDTIMRFLMTVMVATALQVLLYQLVGGPGMTLAAIAEAVLLHVLYLGQPHMGDGRHTHLVSPVVFALTVCLPLHLTLRLWSGAWLTVLELPDAPAVLYTLCLTALTLFTAWKAMKAQGLEPSGVEGAAIFAALTLLALLTLDMPAVVAATGLLILGFHRRSNLMLGVAVAFLLVAGSLYYYDLSLTLLAKALALVGSGLVFLGLHQLFIRRGLPGMSTTEAR